MKTVVPSRTGAPSALFPIEKHKRPTLKIGSVPLFAALFFLVLFLENCHKKEEPEPGFTTGKNEFTITLEGVTRKYVVHVPAVYTGEKKTPMVIFCHGSDQTGDQFYNISGWKEVADTANFLTVFPTALEYCVTEDGVMKTITKWNSFPGGADFCPGQNMKDDVEFMRQIISAMESRYNVDTKRIYMVGFSSGGQFTATCAIKISDILAGVISCGGGGSLPRDTVYTPARKLPVMLMFGNQDEKMLKTLGLPAGAAVPMGFDSLYAAYPQLYAAQAKPYINDFQLNETSYTLSGNGNPVVVADYVGLSGNPDNVFKLVELKGLTHEYPNGVNYPFNGAVYHWIWLKKFALP